LTPDFIKSLNTFHTPFWPCYGWVPSSAVIGFRWLIPKCFRSALIHLLFRPQEENGEHIKAQSTCKVRFVSNSKDKADECI
jgi:hypothetical protein